MSLSAFEKADRIEHKRSDKQKREFWWDNHLYDYHPSGQIEFRLERWPLNRRRWVDLKSARLEDRVTDIVCEIIKSAEMVKIELRRREEKEHREQEERRLAQERRQIQIEDEKRRLELVQQSIDWQRASAIRTYLAAIETAIPHYDVETRQNWLKWFKWGYEHADRVDPLKNGSCQDLMFRTVDQA